MGKKKVNTPTQEELTKYSIDRGINEMKSRIKLGTLPLKPTRSFKNNERILFGAHKEVYVIESFENGLYYLIDAKNVTRNREIISSELHVVPWHDIHKFKINNNTTFSVDNEIDIRYRNGTLQSLFVMVYGEFAGVDFDVEYQRNYVWGLKDKQELIYSIFNNIDIGKFTFIERSFQLNEKYYEILDGKQRLSTLCDFYEDRFKYRGKYFSDLSFKDKRKITECPITFGTISNIDKKEIYKQFIKLNTTGRVMSKTHINVVEDLLRKL